MPRNNLIIFLSYLAVSLMICFAGSAWFGISAQLAAVLGLVTLAICGLAHEVAIRRVQYFRLELGFG